MPALDDFLRDPPRFLRHNHVTYRGQYPDTQGGGEYDFILLPLENVTARTRGGVFLGKSLAKADAGVYEIRWRDAPLLGADRLARGAPFRAIWGGFVAGGKADVALDSNGPDLMLTPELTGCTIAHAAQRNGDARFSHYNMMAGPRTLPGPAMVAAARSDYAGVGNLGVLTREHYHGKSTFETSKERTRPAANVIGWRKGGVWTFWVQYTDVKGTVSQILDVRQLTPGVKIG